jgi:hypothetical protein
LADVSLDQSNNHPTNSTSPAVETVSPTIQDTSKPTEKTLKRPHESPEVENPPMIKTESKAKSHKPEEGDSKIYVPKTIKVATFGGLDLEELGPYLQRPRTGKDSFGINILTRQNYVKESQHESKIWSCCRSEIRLG